MRTLLVFVLGFVWFNNAVSQTTWDDGWVSTIQTDWVKVAKPGISIWIFHPNAATDAYHSEKLKGDQNAWDLLVAPNFKVVSKLLDRGMQSYPSITFFTADAVEKQSGKQVHLVFYKRHYDQGNGRYMLCVADSKAVFEKEFGNNYINTSSWETAEQSKSWDKLANMQWRNKFGIYADALAGNWSSGNSSTLSYYYVSTGNYAGATAVSVADAFSFFPNKKYESDHSGASGAVGNQRFSRTVYKGTYGFESWKITLSNRFKGETESFDCHFEAVKGGLVLVMVDGNKSVKQLVKGR